MFLSIITDPIARETLQALNTDVKQPEQVASADFDIFAEQENAECDCTSHQCTECKYPTCILK